MSDMKPEFDPDAYDITEAQPKLREAVLRLHEARRALEEAVVTLEVGGAPAWIFDSLIDPLDRLIHDVENPRGYWKS